MKTYEIDEDTMAKEIVESYQEQAIEMVRKQLIESSHSYHEWRAWFLGASHEWLQHNAGEVYHPQHDPWRSMEALQRRNASQSTITESETEEKNDK